MERRREVLKELRLLSKDKTLENYEVVDEYHQLKEGRIVRWVNLVPGALSITSGAIVVRSEMQEDGLLVTVKAVGFPRFWSIKFNEVVLFQKLSFEELVLIEAIERSKS